ncbi:XdhC family protein [Castellaniella sp.]|uniref:XdhC family protein n=1 Tax=Castellaniella sp. TaxID=1955812 RepID=UPI00355E3258
MENLDLTVLRTIQGWREAGRRAVLVTVVRTWGSSPRPIGSIMAMRDDGVIVGSVSGGCIEDDLILRYTRHDIPDALPRTGPPLFLQYGLTADEAHRFGLPCGGTLEVVLEFDPDATLLAELVAALDTGALMHRHVDLATGQASLSPSQVPADLELDAQRLVNTFGPEYRMLIIGAGQMSEYLATMAQFCGFEVTVCDPRKEYATVWNVPGVQVVSTMPDDTVLDFRPDARTCVIALTHDPKLDDLALLQALETPAFYIGAIGSRRNNHARRQRMIDYLDQTEASLARLRGPVGIYIGSKTPPEIAVSVMAEVLAIKNGVTLTRDADVEFVKDSQGLVSAGSSCLL